MFCFRIKLQTQARIQTFNVPWVFIHRSFVIETHLRERDQFPIEPERIFKTVVKRVHDIDSNGNPIFCFSRERSPIPESSPSRVSERKVESSTRSCPGMFFSIIYRDLNFLE